MPDVPSEGKIEGVLELDHSVKLYEWIKSEDRINTSGLRFSCRLRGGGHGGSSYVEWGKWGERTTPVPVDDDVLPGRLVR